MNIKPSEMLLVAIVPCGTVILTELPGLDLPPLVSLCIAAAVTGLLAYFTPMNKRIGVGSRDSQDAPS